MVKISVIYRPLFRYNTLKPSSELAGVLVMFPLGGGNDYVSSVVISAADTSISTMGII